MIAIAGTQTLYAPSGEPIDQYPVLEWLALPEMALDSITAAQEWVDMHIPGWVAIAIAPWTEPTEF